LSPPAFRGTRRLLALGAVAISAGCAARGHVATPQEIAVLKEATGLSASGRLSLNGPGGRFSARLIFGVARPGSLRIEIPAGTGLRFLLIAREGRLRAELPQDDAMYEGPGTSAVMKALFGIEIDPQDLVGAILGSPPETLRVGWRFDRTGPSGITLFGPNQTRLSLKLEDPEIQAPGPAAFAFGPPRRERLTLPEMSVRLGLAK
jgi:hypothetical protein